MKSVKTQRKIVKKLVWTRNYSKKIVYVLKKIGVDTKYRRWPQQSRKRSENDEYGCLCAPAESLSKPFGQRGDTLRNPTSFYSNQTNERGSQKKMKNGISPTPSTLFNPTVHLGKCLCPKLGNCGLVAAFWAPRVSQSYLCSLGSFSLGLSGPPACQ